MLEAYRLVQIGSRRSIESALLQATGAERTFLSSVLKVFDGNVGSGIAALRGHVARAKGLERAMVADVLAPIMVMRHDHAQVEALAGHIEAVGWKASAHSLRALASIDLCRFDVAERHLRAASRELERISDSVARCRLLQRVARINLLLGHYDDALNSANESSVLASQIGAWRTAAASHSVAYSIHYSITGSQEETVRSSKLWLEAAHHAEDASFIYSATIAAYSIAVEYGDRAAASRLHEIIGAMNLPQQYAERFPYTLHVAMARGAIDPAEMRNLIYVLAETPGLSGGKEALCSALGAIAAAALLDDEAARSGVAATLRSLRRPRRSEPVYEHFFRRMARVAAAAACVLIGDDVRADRLVAVKELEPIHGCQSVPALVRGRQWREFPPALTGLANIIERATSSRAALQAPAGLTTAEFEVLNLLGRGWTAGRIAKATERSINTVYNHTRSILVKLDAARAPEAVAIARSRGYLP